MLGEKLMAWWRWKPKVLFFIIAVLVVKQRLVTGETANFDWTVSYMNAAPLGVEQKVIAINNQFPGPIVNVTTNWYVVANVQNNLDEPLLITWDGIRQRGSSWQDGVLGTNCPIPPGWNWTYQFQVKDQIGSFFYFPSLNLQRTAGGFGGVIVNSHPLVPLPYKQPDGEDIILFIGDWFNKNHKELRKTLDDGKELGMPDGVLINGKGPYQYNSTLVPAGIQYETINVEPGKTYRFRVHNVGAYTSLNFRIQSHNLYLVETEGSHTSQQNYSNIDVHVGQSYTFLVTMDQNATADYYIVASARFVNESTWSKVKGVAVLHYSNSEGKASGPLPEPPNDIYYPGLSMDQARTIRWNLSASAARPNPQGSYRYGLINVTHSYLFENKPPVLINGKRRAMINGVSYKPPDTPLRLADQYGLKNVCTLDFPEMPRNGTVAPKVASSIINATYKGFVEIVFQNNDTRIQSYHLDGHSIFVVGMDYGVWTRDSRTSYNKWDAIARCTAQVYPGAWTAVMVPLDNVGIWNLRAENLDTWYLGQEVYLKVVNPETNKTEMPMPRNVLYCGLLQKYQKDQNHHKGSSSSVRPQSSRMLVLVVFLAALSMLV